MTMNGCGSKTRIDGKKKRLKLELSKEKPDFNIVRSIKESLKRNKNISKYHKHGVKRKKVKRIPSGFEAKAEDKLQAKKEVKKKSKLTKRGNPKKKSKNPKNPDCLSISEYNQMKKQGKDI